MIGFPPIITLRTYQREEDSSTQVWTLGNAVGAIVLGKAGGRGEAGGREK